MRNPDAGFSLVEVLIALALTLLVISSVTGAFGQAVRLADTARLS
jgi:prepilin-type N-terminal cleavage/methylation domain-containing protein